MLINPKTTGKASSIPAGLAWGATINLVITLLAAMVLAELIDAEKIMWENVGYGVVVMILGASFLGAMAAYIKVKRQRLMICLLSGILYFGMLLSITALFFGGQYEAVGVTALLVLAGSGSAALLGLKSNRGGRHKKSLSRYC